jgi:hypothetical protein
MFITTRVNNILFEGYTDPSVLKYTNLNHKLDNIQFECIDNPHDQCGVPNYHCSNAGMVRIFFFF